MCAFKVEVSMSFLESFGSVGRTSVSIGASEMWQEECCSSIFSDSLVFNPWTQTLSYLIAWKPRITNPN